MAPAEIFPRQGLNGALPPSPAASGMGSEPPVSLCHPFGWWSWWERLLGLGSVPILPTQLRRARAGHVGFLGPCDLTL